MPWIDSDGTLWAIVLLSVGFAYAYIPATLQHVRDLTAVPDSPEPGPKKELRQDAEKALSHNTLRTLSDGYSYHVRAATTKIVVDRTVISRTKKLLLQDLASKHEERRGNAIQALHLLLSNPALDNRNMARHFLDFESFRAIITALQNLLEFHEQPTQGPVSSTRPLPPSPVFPTKRPAHEWGLLIILAELLTARIANTDIECALRAGLVTRWLKHYPFPCALPQNAAFNFKKSDVCRLLDRKVWASDDPRMASIFQCISTFPPAKKQLREAGLCASSYTENISPGWRRTTVSDVDTDVRMVNGDSTAGILTPSELREPVQGIDDDDDDPRPGRRSGTRVADMSQEELNLRRRHRDAIVVAEPGAPLNRNNIHQRQDSWTEEVQARDARTDHVRREYLISPEELEGVRREESATINGELARLEGELARIEASQHLHGQEAQPARIVRHQSIETGLSPWQLHEFNDPEPLEVPSRVSLSPRGIMNEEIEGEARVNSMLREIGERNHDVQRGS